MADGDAAPAPERLNVIAGVAGDLADRLEDALEHGGVPRSMLEELVQVLEAVAVYAVARGPEPQSFRVYGGLRVVDKDE